MKKKVGGSEPKPRIILILDGDKTNDWAKVFSDKTLSNGAKLELVCASWMDVEVTVYEHRAMVKVYPVYSTKGVKKPQSLMITPDFLIVRNQPRGPYLTNDRRNVLFGFMNANIPSVNTLESIYMNLERPIVQGVMKKLQKKHGEKFPIIPITFYSGHRQMTLSDTPCIVKISHAHRGMGKIKCDNMNVFRDVSTVVALNNHYCSSEPFIEVECGIRVQKIGNTYRVYKKHMTGSGWKSQFGGSSLVDEKVTKEYKFWADMVSEELDMDILAIDAVKCKKTKKEFIIEVNGSPIGLQPQHWFEDSVVIRDMVLERMNKLYSK